MSSKVVVIFSAQSKMKNALFQFRRGRGFQLNVNLGPRESSRFYNSVYAVQIRVWTSLARVSRDSAYR